MQHFCAHRWNPRGRWWSGLSQAVHERPIAALDRADRAPSRKTQQKPNLNPRNPMTRNGKIASRPTALREDFINPGYDGSQTRMNNPAESKLIQVNPS
jgi:hypothetical protein